MDKAYDKFDVEIKSVQLLFARAGNILLSFQDLEIRLSSCVYACMCINADDVLNTYPVGLLKKANKSPSVQILVTIKNRD